MRTVVFQSAKSRVFDSNPLPYELEIEDRFGFNPLMSVFDSNEMINPGLAVFLYMFQSANERVFDSMKQVVSGQ